MQTLRRLLAIALLGAVIWAGVQFVRLNEFPVQVDLLLTQVPSVALWLVLLVAFGAGLALAAAICLFEVMRYALVARRYRKAVARLESEVHQLRNLPLADEGASLPAGAPLLGPLPGDPATGPG